MRILIAEDDFTSRSLLIAVLMKYGHEVVATCDGVEAWSAIQRPDAPRLLILDWMMPNMNGIEVCRNIRAEQTDQTPYIIMLTALCDKKHMITALDAGANDYIVKPFDQTELRARIAVGERIIALQGQLSTETTIDALTGLLCRRAGLNTLRRELSRSSREGIPIGVGLLDVDHLKRIKNNHGHMIGDDVLRALSKRLSSTLRPYDHLSRCGGGEFLLVAPGSGSNTGIWERMRILVAQSPFSTSAGNLEITVSIGFASGNSNHSTDELLAAADQALCRAKKSSRNRVESEIDGNQDSGPKGSDSTMSKDLKGPPSSPTKAQKTKKPDHKHVLIAESDFTSRSVLAALLKKHGYKVTVTQNGTEAWAAMQRSDAPRLLILDWMIPGIDGLSICRNIRPKQTNQQPYIIMLIALNDKKHVAEGLDAGADDYVIKPFEHTELKARIAVGKRILIAQSKLLSQTEKLHKALDRIKTLQNFIPLCSRCSRIRDDKYHCHEVEDYILKHSENLFGHELCPKCTKKVLSRCRELMTSSLNIFQKSPIFIRLVTSYLTILNIIRHHNISWRVDKQNRKVPHAQRSRK